jgi:hypothetical protein
MYKVSFSKVKEKMLDENESIIETGDEFSVVNDISITVPKLQE